MLNRFFNNPLVSAGWALLTMASIFLLGMILFLWALLGSDVFYLYGEATPAYAIGAFLVMALTCMNSILRRD